MELATRKRLRAFAWIVFLLASPLLLAYARGYRLPFAPVSQWLIPERPAVGAFVVRTIPRGATLSVDGTVVDRRTPAGLGNVPVGVHVVRMEKEGYRPWEKKLESFGGKVQYLLFTRLLPHTIEEDVVREGVRDAWISPDEQQLLVQETEGFRLLATRATGGEDHLFVRWPNIQRFPLGVSFAPDGSAVALEDLREERAPEFLGVLLLATGRRIEPPLPARFVGWITRGRPTALFLDSAGRLWGQPTDGKPARLAEGVTAASLHPRGILVARTNPEGTPALVLLSEQNASERLLAAPPEAPRALAVSPTGAIAAFGERSGTLFLLPPSGGQWREVARDALGLQWSPDGDKLLYQESPFDAWALNVSEERSVLEAGVPELLVRLSTPLAELRWFPDSQHVLFFEQDILQLAEIDPRDGHRIETLVSTNRGATRALPAEHGDVLYVVVRREGRDVLVRLFLRTAVDR